MSAIEEQGTSRTYALHKVAAAALPFTYWMTQAAHTLGIFRQPLEALHVDLEVRFMHEVVDIYVVGPPL